MGGDRLLAGAGRGRAGQRLVRAAGSARAGSTSCRLLGFAAGSALCGLAWDLNSMVAFRVLQAIPGGVLPVVTLTILYRIVPPEQIGAAMGMYGLGIIVAPGRRPHAGRLPRRVRRLAADLLHQRAGRHPRHGRGGALSCRSFGPSAGGPLRRARLPRHRHRAGPPAAGADRGPVLGLDVLPDHHPARPSACSAWRCSSIIELEVDHPLLDVRVFRHWPFTNSLLLISVLSVGLFAVLFYIPLLLQQAQGLGAFDTGLLLLPQALVMAVLHAGRPGCSTTGSARAGPP